MFTSLYLLLKRFASTISFRGQPIPTWRMDDPGRTVRSADLARTFPCETAGLLFVSAAPGRDYRMSDPGRTWIGQPEAVAVRVEDQGRTIPSGQETGDTWRTEDGGRTWATAGPGRTWATTDSGVTWTRKQEP